MLEKVVKEAMTEAMILELAQAALCLATSPRFASMAVADAIAEMKNNGAWPNSEVIEHGDSTAQIVSRDA